MNLILIAIDTLRSDALSCYGNRHPTSPNIDQVARDGTLFENFYSVGNCTHPGFTAMFSGMFPESTRVVSHWTEVFPDEKVKMMQQYFSETGYYTAAMDNLYDGWVPRHPVYTWFRDGYEYYEYPKKDGFYQSGADVSQMACEWIRSTPREPFLLFIHYWDTHSPYNKAPPEEYVFYEGGDPCDPRLDFMPPSIRDAQRRVFGRPITDPSYVVSAYYAEAAYVDRCIGIVLEELDSQGLADDTIVAITSDHGDIMPLPRLALGRLWAFCHIGLNEDCLRVPLIVRGPGVEKGRRVSERFQLVDLLPSLLDLGGVRWSGLDGMSLKKALAGEKSSGRPTLYFSENTYQKQRALLAWPWKYMRMEHDYNSMPPRCLYNLENDPMETENLIDEEADMVDGLDSLVDGYIREYGGGVDPIKQQPVTSSI